MIIASPEQTPDWYKVLSYDRMRELLESQISAQLERDAAHGGPVTQVIGWWPDDTDLIAVADVRGWTNPVVFRLPIPELDALTRVSQTAPFVINEENAPSQALAHSLVDLPVQIAGAAMLERVNQAAAQMQQVADIVNGALARQHILYEYVRQIAFRAVPEDATREELIVIMHQLQDAARQAVASVTAAFEQEGPTA